MPDHKNQQKPTKNHNTHRAHELVATVKRLGGSARTSHLAEIMDVSEETVRRTVKKLSKENLVTRVHGGVYLAETQGAPSFHTRIGENADQKRCIALSVADLIDDGASLFLDVGSTTVFIAEALRKKKKLMIVTNSLSVAQTLMNHNDNRIYLAGGELNNNVGGTFGASARKFVAKFRADFAILSADAVDAKQGFLLLDEREAELAQTYIAHARKSIMVADSTKTEQVAPMVSCDPNEINFFVTDARPNKDIVEALTSWNIELVIAPETHQAPKKKKHK